MSWLSGLRLTRDACGYKVLEQRFSPDGRLKAARVEVDCGATTDFATWAVVGAANAPLRFEEDRLVSVAGRAMKIAWEGSKLVVFVRAPPAANRGPAAAHTSFDVRAL